MNPSDHEPSSVGRLTNQIATAGVVLLVLASWPGALFESWTPRMAALLLVGAAGLFHLLRFALAKDAASLAACAVIGWTWVVSALSSAPRSSMVGFVGRDLSALTLTLSLGCWAIGRSAGVDGRLIQRVFVLSAAAVALVAIVQTAFQIETGFLALQDGRPASLLVNPVYLGAVCAAGCVAAVASSSSRVSVEAGLAVGVTGAAVSLSGSRVALALLLAVLGAIVWRRRSRVTTIVSGIAAAGIGSGVLLDVVVGSGQNAAGRFGGSGGGGRTSIWRYGLEAFLDRPVTGHGIGLFRSAVQGRFDPDFVQQYASDDFSQPWFDPHNVLILALTSIGVVGLILVFIWLYLGRRGTHGPMLWAVLPIAGSWLLQPVSIHTLPVALLLFGAASVRPPSAVDDESVSEVSVDSSAERRQWELAALMFGVAAAGWLLIADMRLRESADRLSPAAAESAAGWYGNDPIVADVVAQIYEIERGPTIEGMEWRERAVARDPERPYLWTQLGWAQLRVGRGAAAAASAAEALELQPTNIAGHELALAAHVELDELQAAEREIEALCGLSVRWCGVDVGELTEQP